MFHLNDVSLLEKEGMCVGVCREELSWRISRERSEPSYPVMALRRLNMHDRPPVDRRKRRIVNQQRVDAQLPGKSK